MNQLRPQVNSVNNALYNDLGKRWYEAQDDPVALLRAESRLRNPWVQAQIKKQFPQATHTIEVLDLGCGGGFLSNSLAQSGYRVVGVDLSATSLQTAQDYDKTKTVNYVEADALKLPFSDQRFDVVCAMDFLEHVEDPAAVIAEAARVLKPGGAFYFYTFNRNWLSWLLVIKGVEWFVKNTPPHLHIYQLFIKPRELRSMCQESGLRVDSTLGIKPVLWSKNLWKLIRTGIVPSSFQFEFTQLKFCGYLCSGTKSYFPKEHFLSHSL